MSSPSRAPVLLVLLGVVVAMLPGCDSRVEPPPIRILAASSLESVAISNPAHGSREVSVGASSVLAMQLIASAPADVVLLADPLWMDELEAEGVVDAGSRVEIARNRLVLAVPLGEGTPSGDGIPAGRLAIAEPRHVPLGRYTIEALRSLGWWTSLEDRVVLASDAGAVLALVESGEVDAGVVYASDARRSRRIEVVRILDESLHRPIRCEAARISDRDSAGAFIDRLLKPAGRAMVETLGFQAPGNPERRNGHE